MASKQVIKEKKELIKEIEGKISASASVLVWKYHGLPVEVIKEIKDELAKTNAFSKVYKNNMAKFAFDSLGYKDINEKLVGPNAFAFSSEEDAIAAARTLNKFKKDYDCIEFNVGVFENEVIDSDKWYELSTMPSKPGLLSMLLSCLKAPLRDMAYGLKQVEEKSENK